MVALSLDRLGHIISLSLQGLASELVCAAQIHEVFPLSKLKVLEWNAQDSYNLFKTAALVREVEKPPARSCGLGQTVRSTRAASTRQAS